MPNFPKEEQKRMRESGYIHPRERSDGCTRCVHSGTFVQSRQMIHCREHNIFVRKMGICPRYVCSV